MNSFLWNYFNHFIKQFLAGDVFRGEPHTETLFGKFDLVQRPFSGAWLLTEDLEEFKYSSAFMKLLLTQVSENRSPKESLKWLGIQVQQWSQYCWCEIPRAVGTKGMLLPETANREMWVIPKSLSPKFRYPCQVALFTSLRWSHLQQWELQFQ